MPDIPCFKRNFLGESDGKASAYNAGDLGSVPGLGRSSGEGNDNPLQYSCLENPMDGAAWWAAVHGVMKSQTRLSDFPFTFHFHALEKQMATHSSVLAWRIPGKGESGGAAIYGVTWSCTRLKRLSSSSKNRAMNNHQSRDQYLRIIALSLILLLLRLQKTSFQLL